MKQTGKAVVLGSRDNIFCLRVFFYHEGKLYEETVRPSCKHERDVKLLGITVSGGDFLAVSCRKCRDIKLMNLNKQQITRETRKSFLGFINEQKPEIIAAFSGQYVYGMYEGQNNRLFVQSIIGQVLELDISSTKFTQLRTIKIGTHQNMCYVPLHHDMICAASRGEVRAISCSDGSSKWVVKDAIEFKQINPGVLLYSTLRNLLLISDSTNDRILVLDPSNGTYLVTIEVRDMGTIFDMCLHNDQIAMIHGSADNFNLSYFSVR